jgi:hypothetical protein
MHNHSMTTQGMTVEGPHGINFGSEEHGDHWFMYCTKCLVGLVNKHRAGKPDELFTGHDGRPDLDEEPAEPGLPTHPIPLEYCCASLGWVPPSVRFDHQWDDSGAWDDD